MTTHADIHHVTELQAATPALEHLGVDIAKVILGDRPDLVLPEYEGKRIGIEVVELRPTAINCGKKGISMAKVEDRINRVCEKIKKRLIAQGMSHTFVHISFTDKAESLELNIPDREFQQRVFEEIERHMLYDTVYRNRHSNPERYLQLDKAGCFNYEYVGSYQEDESRYHTFISPVSVFYVESVTWKHILTVVRNKEEKLAAYKGMECNQSIDEYWLVINVPKNERHDFDDLQSFELDSQYTRIYLTQWRDYKQLK